MHILLIVFHILLIVLVGRICLHIIISLVIISSVLISVCLIKYSDISICNRMRPSRIKDKFSREFSKFSQNSRRGQFVKTLKIQVKFILNSTRTQCDYLFITQRAKFSETFPCTLKHNQPALRISRIKVPARKQFTKQAV